MLSGTKVETVDVEHVLLLHRMKLNSSQLIFYVGRFLVLSGAVAENIFFLFFGGGRIERDVVRTELVILYFCKETFLPSYCKMNIY